MDQKDVECKSSRLYRTNFAVPLWSVEHFSLFELIVLVAQPFTFCLHALNKLVSSNSRQLSSVKRLINPAQKTDTGINC